MMAKILVSTDQHLLLENTCLYIFEIFLGLIIISIAVSLDTFLEASSQSGPV